MKQNMEELHCRRSFSSEELIQQLSKDHADLSRITLCRRIRKMIQGGELIRAARDIYTFPPEHSKPAYEPIYSSAAESLAEQIRTRYADMDFRISELAQLNEFVNHLFGRNTIYLAVEKDLIDFVFDDLKEEYPGMVLKRPTAEEYFDYGRDGCIVLQRLLKETPMGKTQVWHISLEQVLVDIYCDKLLQQTIARLELAGIYETAFERYAVEEKKMLRYARRRNCEKEIQGFITDSTNIELVTATAHKAQK